MKILVKENIPKGKHVYRLSNSYLKTYRYLTIAQLEKHVSIMHELLPGYIVNHGIDGDISFLECRLIKGTPCNVLHHPVQEIYKVCIDSMIKTYPYMHMDWAPSNILYDGTNYHLVDWDNVGIYDVATALSELDTDMREYYGLEFDLFVKHFADDFASLRAPVLAIVSPV